MSKEEYESSRVLAKREQAILSTPRGRRNEAYIQYLFDVIEGPIANIHIGVLTAAALPARLLQVAAVWEGAVSAPEVLTGESTGIHIHNLIRRVLMQVGL